MTPAVFECVMNVSEGRDRRLVDELGDAAGPVVLDVHSDPDHHRSVFTLGGDLAAVEAGARRLAAAARERLDLRVHHGVHPRLGVVDVVPFVALADDGRPAAVEAARSFAAWWARTAAVPVYLYGEAHPAGRTLPEVRRLAAAGVAADLGPGAVDPRWGATAVGARPPLVAFNCELETADVEVATAIASRVRERDGGLPGVRALGLALASTGRTQVSMNLVALEETGVEAAWAAVVDAARAAGTSVRRAELVGLVPAAEARRWSPAFVESAGLDPGATVEERLAAAAEAS